MLYLFIIKSLYCQDILSGLICLDSNVFIGSKLYEAPDVEDKLSIFIAKYSYDPMLYSPNDNPETELAFQAGDYLYVFGDVDEVSGK